jgi:SAM-dependent methyltransferase
MSRIPALVAEGVLRCIACKGALAMVADAVRCTACRRTFGYANGALDLYGAHEGAPRATPDPAFVKAVAAALRLPDTPDILARAADAVAGTLVTTGDPHHSAEIAELADRLGIAQPPAATPSAPGPVNVEPRVAWGVHFLERELPRGADLYRSIRIANAGGSTLSSSHTPPAFLSYHWQHGDGRMAHYDGERSRLPVALAPGHEVTVISRVRTPAKPGDYRLQYQLVLEGERWIDPPAPAISVRVGDAVKAPPGLEDTGQEYDYGGDHHVGAEMVFAHIRKVWPTTPLRVLEVGAGIHPSMAALARFGHTVTSLDISFPMAQLGQLYFDHVEGTGESFAFVACDAARAPVAEGSFDCAAVFSAVHHFPRPDLLLETLARLVRPDGFIAVMCEPCVPDPEGAMYLRDLAKGINEQIWSLPEWRVIFERAGLRILEGRVDRGSLKVILGRGPQHS